MNIQWYPGHMARAKKIIKESLKLVDVVFELLDARIPASSRNPLIQEILGQKPELLVLNKADLASPVLTRAWLDWFTARGIPAVATDSLHRQGIEEVFYQTHFLVKNKMGALLDSGRRGRLPRCMVVGIPNTGKSQFINSLVGRRVARIANRPGITRGKQWIRTGKGLELLDTPGILWPKLGNHEVSLKLAATGAIREEVFDVEEVVTWLLNWLMLNDPSSITKQYRINLEGNHLLEQIGKKKGFIGTRGMVDRLRTAVHILKDFREGRLGRFTLEPPPRQ